MRNTTTRASSAVHSMYCRTGIRTGTYNRHFRVYGLVTSSRFRNVPSGLFLASSAAVPHWDNWCLPNHFPIKLLSELECQIHCNMFLHRVNNNINAALHLCMCTGMCTGLTFSTQLDIFRPKKCGGEGKWSLGVRRMCVSPVSHPIYLPNTQCKNPDLWTGQNRSPIFWYVVLI